MARHGRTLLMMAMALAMVGVFPASGLAQTASPAQMPSEPRCVPNESDGSCLPIAPERARVDLAEPSFSDPTTITNPLFPISDLTQVIQLGTDAGEPLRVEVTLLPETRTIAWNGKQVETVASQFVAYLDGRIVEVATDYFAQADDGAVWYFGEDVVNYEDGAVADTNGTWLAGKDGPPGMIMPGDPQPGDVYRPENIPDLVFEEVTVKAVNQTVDGPRGPIEGAILVQELLMDGTRENKTFAPGYGEFSAEAGTESLVVALAVPDDARAGAVPAELQTLSTIAAIPEGDWDTISANVTTITGLWDTLQAGDVPPVVGTQMNDALAALVAAVDARSADDAHQAAIDVGRASLDIQLQYRTPSEIDLDRLALSTDQFQLDRATNDTGTIAGDVVVMESIWARVAHTVAPNLAARIDAQLGDLRAAIDAGDLAGADDIATDLHDMLIGR